MAYARAIAASLVNINVGSPGASIDGVMLNNGDRVLLTRQTTPSQNGVWIFDTDVTTMSRPGSPDQYQSGMSFDNATVIWVTGGDTLAGTVGGSILRNASRSARRRTTSRASPFHPFSAASRRPRTSISAPRS